MSQQLCDLQCQFVALAEKERASSNFKKEALRDEMTHMTRREVGVYLDQVIHSTRDSEAMPCNVARYPEARCRGLGEQLARLEQEASATSQRPFGIGTGVYDHCGGGEQASQGTMPTAT